MLILILNYEKYSCNMKASKEYERTLSWRRYKAIDIFNKEFKVKMRGFDPDEVDEFLDNIMKDYETFNKEILALQEENDRLNAKINQLNKSQAVMSKIQPESQKSQTVTNFDILKRLSNLEKEVFGKKLDQEVTIEPSSYLIG